MSTREVIRTNGDWHVQSSGDLHFETQYASGNNGNVYVYGNLLVAGTTTSITSTDLDITDKVLVLNKGEIGLNPVNGVGTSAGVGVDGISGISIERGGPAQPNENANLFFNQNKNWTYNGNTTNGMWEFIIGPPSGGVGTHSGLTVNAIRTGTTSTNLSLLGAENPSALVTLEGVVGYTDRVRNSPTVDVVPNKGYVDYAIIHAPDRRRIELTFYYDNNGNAIPDTSTFSELTDVGYGDAGVTEPQLRTSIGGNMWVTTYNDRMVIGDIKILDGNEITMENPSTKLVLSTRPGASSTVNPSIELKTSLSMVIDTVYDEPSSESGRVKVYPGNEGQGGTGLYFVNKENVRDELVSKRRSFFASLMF